MPPDDAPAADGRAGVGASLRAVRPWQWLVAGGFAALAVYVGLVFAHRGSGHLDTGDSNNLVAGARTALHCLRDGVFTECAVVGAGPRSLVFPYPLLQYLPAAGFVAAGAADPTVVRWLGVVSWFAFAATLVIVVWTLRRHPLAAALGVAALLGSSATYHATSAFGEMLAASAVVAAVAAATTRRTVLIAVLFFVAALSKETMGPFLVVLGLVAGRQPGDRWVPRRAVTLAVVGGALAGMVASALFNVFRFGSLRNVAYLDPEFRTRGLDRIVTFFVAQWVSPSSGIPEYWPVATAIVLVGAGVSLARWWSARSQHRSVDRDDVRIVAVAVATVGFTAGLALWYSPFGWIAYGPRLAVPLLPAAALTVLHLAGPRLDRWARRCGPVAIGLLVVAVVAVSFPQYGAPWRWWPGIQALIAPDASCPSLLEFGTDVEAGDRCFRRLMFRARPSVLAAVLRGGGWQLWTARATAAASVALLVVGARSLAQAGGGPSAGAEIDDRAGLEPGDDLARGQLAE